jgi:hypothetical protein
MMTLDKIIAFSVEVERHISKDVKVPALTQKDFVPPTQYRDDPELCFSLLVLEAEKDFLPHPDLIIANHDRCLVFINPKLNAFMRARRAISYDGMERHSPYLNFGIYGTKWNIYFACKSWVPKDKIILLEEKEHETLLHFMDSKYLYSKTNSLKDRLEKLQVEIDKNLEAL